VGLTNFDTEHSKELLEMGAKVVTNQVLDFSRTLEGCILCQPGEKIAQLCKETALLGNSNGRLPE
jgi:hypothetical protein